MGTPALVEVDDDFVVLELLDRRRKPVRLERPPPPAPPPPLIPPEKAPPPPPWGCELETCRVGYNLAAVEQKEEGEAGESTHTGYIYFLEPFMVIYDLYMISQRSYI